MACLTTRDLSWATEPNLAKHADHALAFHFQHVATPRLNLGSIVRHGALAVLLAVVATACTGITRPLPPPEAPASMMLGGTSWQLVEFEGGDGTTLTPDERGKYTISFSTDGQLTARLDCNRGLGTWTSGGQSHLEFGPLSVTRAACPQGSLHDQIVEQWPYIRSYVIRDGHLFLALMADGGIYEFEPVNKVNP
jgi:heat shock protein HslJ